MEFVKSEFLSLLLIFPFLGILIVWSNSQRKDALSRVGNPRLINQLSLNVSIVKRRNKMTLWLFSLILICIATARPLWGTQVSVKIQ